MEGLEVWIMLGKVVKVVENAHEAGTKCADSLSTITLLVSEQCGSP